jgi:hypothetical protein
MTIKAKAHEIGKIHFKTCTFEHICFKCALSLQIMSFEIVSNKNYSFLCNLKHGCIIYINNIDQDIIKLIILKT